jgi:predicted AlkP superfamily pyrophosphatase or phosphodiesterase
MNRTFALRASALLCVFVTAAAHAAAKPHVLMVSIDGMRPDYVTHAAEHHVNVPTLARFMVEGAYADGVVGVFPTMTYPSHTTLVTGVWPARHGIYNNNQFRPLDPASKDTYHLASEVKAEELWQAAQQAGLTTASIGWPVTGENPYITWNAGGAAESEEGGEQVDRTAHLRSLGLSGSGGGDKDAKRAAWAIDIIRLHHPNFITVHLGLTDEEQHAHGPFSPEADKALEAIDGELAQLIHAELSVDPKATIVVVSDHGFVAVNWKLNLSAYFAQNGLIHTSSTDPNDRHPKVISWDAAVWESGGSAAIMLHNPNDKAMYDKVYALLKKAQADPSMGIKRVLTRDEFLKDGANPEASFFIDLQPGFKMGNNLGGKVVQSTPGMGTHGYLPDQEPQVRAAFFVMGPDIARGKDLGIVDMRQIAPTVAQLLGVSLPAAKQPPLSIHPNQ